MTQTLQQLRTALGWSVSRLFAGTATGGSTTTLIDTAGLLRFTETDTLQGAQLYIHTTTDGLAPQGQSRRIQGYVVATQTITVDRAFTVTVGAGDLYEIYLAPLTIDQWNGCINDAIRDAWPELFVPAWAQVLPTGVDHYHLLEAVDRVLGAEIQFTGALAGYPSDDLLDWWTVGESGNLELVVSRPVPNDVNMIIRLLVGLRFDELVAGQSTNLDTQYVLDAARARFYQRMADASRQSERGGFLQLMAHWQEKAEERRRRLSSILWGETPEEKE